MTPMRFQSALLGLVIGFGAHGALARPALAAAAADAAAVIAEARKALGGEQKLDAVQAFSVEGSFRRLMGPRQLEGSLELVAERPERCAASRTWPSSA